ncbi:hypothetical protein R1flu_003534 [Riccia fluitans]|uniref:Uncharacterized protein n=1 Tax=Riccia fluitans TaxID=41844 RepID=A0ABD1YCY4_9MARC
MEPRSSKNLKTKEVKIPHPIVPNKKKMETWGLGGLFAADWNGTYDNLVEELAERKVLLPKYEYHGKPEEWTANIWREVYNLPKMLNAVFVPVRPKHFQHNLLAFYHHAWAAITNPTAPTSDCRDAVEKTVSRQIKALRVCNEATCIGSYLAHLYSHFHEIDAKEKEDSKKHRALISRTFLFNALKCV